jgi:hypothetical protein
MCAQVDQACPRRPRAGTSMDEQNLGAFPLAGYRDRTHGSDLR